jgi:hypothetical protein
MLLAQFWMVVYRQRPPRFTRISTTAECRLSLVYIGAVHPST